MEASEEKMHVDIGALRANSNDPQLNVDHLDFSIRLTCL